MDVTLQSPIEEFPRVGKVLGRKLRKLGIEKVIDLLSYYPFRYDDLSAVQQIGDLLAGQRATIKVKIDLIENRRSPYRRKLLTEALVSDKSGSLKVIWFNQPFLTKVMKAGDNVYLSGKVDSSEYGFQMISPTYEKVRREQIHTARIVPVYSLTEELTNKQLRFLVKTALPLIGQVQDWVPDEIRTSYHLADLRESIRQVHFPANERALKFAQNRLKFNELFTMQLKAQLSRKMLEQERAPSIPFNEALTKRFIHSLPFQLTRAQKKVTWEIVKDLQRKVPMNRLLEGDVGSGKTVVAAIAILNAVHAGYQVAFMAPTEILVLQHYKKLRELLEPFRVQIGLLTGSTKKVGTADITQKVILNRICAGELPLIIGTHALIQRKVEFKNLGLIIIDEQHRFGVEQRKKLKRQTKTFIPHLLSMTATPIPRTLALTLYGDLDLSIIDEMPPGRKKIITKIIAPHERTDAYQFIRNEIEHGRQAFVICPLIDPSDKLGVKAATEESKRLKRDIFPDMNVGLLHGKMNTKTKEHAMRQFATGKTHTLVATPVVEVGIDIPNASVMFIESAERFGLAQLHQFRGRVGRAEHQSYCFLFTETENAKTQERLRALVESENGFELAEKDLEFRGPGEVYGLKQAGFPDFKMAKLTDYQIIQQTREAAQQLINRNPDLSSYPLLRKKMAYFSRKVHME